MNPPQQLEAIHSGHVDVRDEAIDLGVGGELGISEITVKAHRG